MGKILQADMQLSSQCDDCWSSHIPSARNGLPQSYMFKERLLCECESIDLSRFVQVVDLRHLDYWAPYSDTHPQERNSTPLIIIGAHSLQREPWSRVHHASFPDTCFSTFLRTVSAAWHASDFVLTPYKLKQWPGLTIPPLLVTRAMLIISSSHTIHCVPIPWELKLAVGKSTLDFVTNVTCMMSRTKKYVLFLCPC